VRKAAGGFLKVIPTVEKDFEQEGRLRAKMTSIWEDFEQEGRGAVTKELADF
jgi:hypothetical protein